MPPRLRIRSEGFLAEMLEGPEEFRASHPTGDPGDRRVERRFWQS
jgi:hypothetical protein